MTVLIALDTETTGLAKTVGSEDFVQLAAFMHREGSGEVAIFNELAIPRVPISEGAARVHGHTLDTLKEAGAKGSSAVANEFAHDVASFCGSEPYIIAAHNLKYDEMILKGHPPLELLLDRAAGFICTRRAAERLMPLIDNHQLPTVMVACGLLTPGAAHEGLSDAESCFMLARQFAKLKGGYEALANWLANPVLLEVMPFSKRWKGVEFGKIDSGFLEWCLKQADMNEDVRHTAACHLIKRKGGVTDMSDDPDDDVPWS
jgi:DNA polymerase III alpha subunit (gram-positive type)